MSDIQVTLNTKGMDEAIRRAGTDGAKLMDELAELFVGNVKVSFNTSPDGRTYTGSRTVNTENGTFTRKGRVHVASSPGHPPNIDTGAYVNSLRWESAGQLDREVFGLEYGKYLEDSSELNRPHLNPAMRQVEKDIKTVAQRYIKLG